MSDFEPFYNVDLSYEDNYARGPFGEFAAALRGDVPVSYTHLTLPTIYSV